MSDLAVTKPAIADCPIADRSEDGLSVGGKHKLFCTIVLNQSARVLQPEQQLAIGALGVTCYNYD